ncbi:MAG TPA: hypothetical protein VMW27_23945 [Thermoanaerobaculia bacterium]|nr:hypothetical protein [Thermoanaerobaculia bacterium]
MPEDLNPNVPEGAETAHDTTGTDPYTAADTVVPAQDRFSQSRYQRISDDVRRGAERARTELRHGAERARETYQDAAENARVGFERVRAETGNVTQDVGAWVRDNPARSVLIAAGVGFLFGMLVRRNDDDEDE